MIRSNKNDPRLHELLGVAERISKDIQELNQRVDYLLEMLRFRFGP